MQRFELDEERKFDGANHKITSRVDSSTWRYRGGNLLTLDGNVVTESTPEAEFVRREIELYESYGARPSKE